MQIISQNNGSSARRFIPDTQHSKGKNTSLHYNKAIPIFFLVLMSLIPLTISLSLPFITSPLIQKQQLILTLNQLVQDSSQLKVSTFFGLLTACFLSSLVLIFYEGVLFHSGRKAWISYIILPVPVILPILFLFDISMGVRATNLVENLHKLKDKTVSSQRLRGFKGLTIIGSVVITLFLQLISFHFHWFILMLVSFPLEVGSLLVSYTAFFCAVLFFTSGCIHSFFGCACGSTSKLRSDELCGTGGLFWALFVLSVVYTMTVTIGGVNYHDGMSSLMPNFLPYIIIGLSLWFFKQSKLTEKPPGAEDEEHYLEEKLKLLSNEEEMKPLSNDEEEKLLSNEEV